MRAEEHIRKRLNQLLDKGLYRRLPQVAGQIDFCSNDYLGMARDPMLREGILQEMMEAEFIGATGSRLISGNYAALERLEKDLASYYKTEAAILFPAGYLANLALLSCLCGRNDTILYDQMVHASIKDGLRMGPGKKVPFLHNDLNDLEQKLKKAEGVKYVVTESLFSMDGDFAPLKALSQLCDQHEAQLIVDEAHTTGLYHEEGSSYVEKCGLTEQVFARVHTFGKAFGIQGAAICGPQFLRDWVENTSRPFIYSTGLSYLNTVSIAVAFRLIQQTEAQKRRKALSKLIYEFGELFKQACPGPIQHIPFPGNKEVMQAAEYLQAQDFAVVGIRSPTVPTGTERLRICLHSYNSLSQLEQLQKALVEIEKALLA